ncbi:hypothetical protein MtrunA17_Chr8g0369181 [Medicago truncatula]|uniref:Uncharacterized protein n=1 Tax=Medicago truncatula TaxID=3880 RepID=A0A396GKV1_MEDTR|nr:hypothetical protein MtrunA17_Chr8g0369181 [Medicago truncatula]
MGEPRVPWQTMLLFQAHEHFAIPRAIGSLNLSLSRVACTKFAPTRPVTTTTAAVRDGLAPVHRK